MFTIYSYAELHATGVCSLFIYTLYDLCLPL